MKYKLQTLLHKINKKTKKQNNSHWGHCVTLDVWSPCWKYTLWPSSSGATEEKNTQPPLSALLHLRPGRLSGYLGDKSTHTHARTRTLPCLICVVVSVESGQTHWGSSSSSSFVHPARLPTLPPPQQRSSWEKKICDVSSATICQDVPSAVHRTREGSGISLADWKHFSLNVCSIPPFHPSAPRLRLWLLLRAMRGGGLQVWNVWELPQIDQSLL